MAGGINRVILIGNLTRDPELRYTPSETPIGSFGLAVNSREKVNGEWQDRPDFFDVTVYGNQAEACAQYLAKGKQCGVEGRLRQDRWEDRETGAKRSKVIVIADAVQFLGPRDGSEPHRSQASPTAADADFSGADFGASSDDDIPF